MLAKDLTKEEAEDYINMFKRYPHLFITDYSMIKGVDVIKHHIDLKPDAKQVAQKLRRLGVVQQEALLFEINKLLKAGFIYPVTNFEWISPVVVTPKKNGKWRVCVDYKPLNAATNRDHFPLPFQDVILNEVARHEHYTICDGYSGYYQIRIAEEDQHKTTFITPWGCFAFQVLPFGLTNTQSTFTMFTSFIFQPFFGKSIRVFLDDFCTHSDRALHCQRVEEGLQKLYQYGGQLNLDKCHVAEKEVVLLGHVISQEGVKVDPSRVQAILDLPPPNSARQVITFVQKELIAKTTQEEEQVQVHLEQAILVEIEEEEEEDKDDDEEDGKEDDDDDDDDDDGDGFPGIGPSASDADPRKSSKDPPMGFVIKRHAPAPKCWVVVKAWKFVDRDLSTKSTHKPAAVFDGTKKQFDGG
ncbi:hypothetical protein L7F22_037461 [Adiantum nelumboides]|nr:hypothetical protein [Adiantum nelumboides]